MNKQIKSQGFTIVELLIVIVIIAILAAITMVAYNGITNRAHGSAAKQAAQNVANKAEAYNAEKGNYPSSTTSLTSTATGNADGTTTDSSWYMPASSVSFGTPASGQTNDSTVSYESCNSNKGATVTYWDYEKKTTGSVKVGSCS